MCDRVSCVPGLSLVLLVACAQGCHHAGAGEPRICETKRRPAEQIIAARMRPDALEDLGVDKNSPFGVCGSAFGAECLRHLGLSWTRMGVPEFKPQQAATWLKTKGDAFPFSASATTVLDAGGQVLGLINFKDTAKWVGSDDDSYLTIVSRCTYNMVEAHKSRIHCWEVINEPDVFSPGVAPRDMARIVKVAIEAARRADPECFILSPCPTSILYMEELLEAGIGPLVDGFAVHVYSHGGAMRDCLRDWKKLFADYGFGGKPVWVTETGWRSEVKYAEGEQEKQQWFRHLDDQAQMLVKGHVRMLAEGIERIIWYNLTDVSNVRAKENFGLLWSAGGPRGRGKRGKGWRIDCDHAALKPSGLASHVLADALGLCPRFRREITARIGVRLFGFETAAGPVVVAWAREDCVLPIPTGGASLKVTDLYGGSYTFHAHKGLCRMRLGSAPVYIRGADADKLARPAYRIAWPKDPRLRRGDSVSMPLRVINTTDAPLTGKLVIMPAPGLFSDPDSIDLTIQPQGQHQASITLSASAKLPAGVTSVRCMLHRGTLPPVPQMQRIHVTAK